VTSASTSILLVGAGGHCRSVIGLVAALPDHQIVGILDDDKPIGTRILGHAVIGRIDDITAIAPRHRFDDCFVAIGDNSSRSIIVRKLRHLLPDLRFRPLVHPNAIVPQRFQPGAGSLVMAGAVIGNNTTIGDFSIVNTAASLDHDCNLGTYASIAPGVHTGGGVTIGDGAAIGVGAAISHGIQIGPWTVVGVGSAVVDNLPDHVVAFGVPARPVRARSDDESYL
jgi:sugar O-acyltransferase (sialic acid O-acetyltransferase NeuD family)